MWGSASSNGTIGLVAGSGAFPVLVAKTAASGGKKVTVFGIEGCYDEAIADFAEAVHPIRLGHVEQFTGLLKEHRVKKLILAGGVPKKEMFNPAFAMDASAKKIMQKTSNRGDDHLLRAFQIFLKVQCGVSIMDPRHFLKRSLCPKGTFIERKPTEEEWRDLRFGWNAAKGIGRMDIGQTVVVKQRVVLAVEAIEGTNHAILRGGELGGGEVVVVKRTKPNQGLRFDLPCVGLETLETLKTVSSRVLGLEAHKTLLISKEELIQKANDGHFTLVGL